MKDLIRRTRTFLTFDAPLEYDYIHTLFFTTHTERQQKIPTWRPTATRQKPIAEFWFFHVLVHFLAVIGLAVLFLRPCIRAASATAAIARPLSWCGLWVHRSRLSDCKCRWPSAGVHFCPSRGYGHIWTTEFLSEDLFYLQHDYLVVHSFTASGKAVGTRADAFGGTRMRVIETAGGQLSPF